jgi:predicted nuclease of predicted toxin-antitoxin system
VAIDYPASISDRQILAIAHLEGRLLVTLDTDFGELLVRDGLAHAGIILLRLRVPSLPVQHGRVRHVLDAHGDQLDQLIVVTDSEVRIR